MLGKKMMTSMTSMMIMTIRSYSELRRISGFIERYEYLCLRGSVGIATFGFDRHINQALYHSAEWKHTRREVILRDNGCDLGVSEYELHGSLLVHHMNPLSADDILDRENWVLDPEYLITTSNNTHNAIHYGDQSLLRTPFVERTSGDTQLW